MKQDMTGVLDVDELLSKLNVTEKVSLLSGADWWHTVALPKYGIPTIRVSDGPNGVRGTRFFNGIKAACFPCGTAIGATWDVKLLHRAGVVMGEESKSKGAHVILGPTINMQRSPLGGRGFESISEDPVLAGLGAAALVNGIQETGVVAAIKHFVCNDQEHERNGYNAIITDRALREIYTLPFQLVVKESNPGCFMTAYNKVNGLHVSENSKILKDILRGEWGWQGCVMSDWWGTYSTTRAMTAGLDLEMPGPTRWRGDLAIQAVGAYKIPEHVLDDRVRNVLQLINRCAPAKIPERAEEKTANTPETAALLRKIGAESIVLMKNDRDILPFRKDKKTLIVGPNAKIATYHGGGSAALAAYYAITPFDGIRSQLTSEPLYTLGCHAYKELPLLDTLLRTATGEPGISFCSYNDPPIVQNREVADSLVLTRTEFLLADYKPPSIKSELFYADIEGYFTADFTGDFELGLGVYGLAKLYVNDNLLIDNETVQTKGTMFFNCGTVEEKGILQVKEGEKYHLKIQFSSAPSCKLDQTGSVAFGGGAVRLGGTRVIDHEKEVAYAALLATNASQVVICAGLNSDWEVEGSDRSDMALPGHMDALISTVVAANPNTVVVMQSGTPVAMPWAGQVKALLHAWYGGNETGNAIADVLFGNVNPSAKLPLSFPRRLQETPAFLSYRTEKGRTLYGEDVYVGYRWYEALDFPVLFPFGHGLSYTKFSYSDLAVQNIGNVLFVSVCLQNVGRVAGAEVVQIYTTQKNASIKRPRKELKGFRKVWLQPGESRTVVAELETKYLGFWDEIREAWSVEKGVFGVIVNGSSDEDGALRAEFTVEKTSYWNGL